jgi:hypothetical protein
LWSMMKELIRRVLVGFGSQNVAEFMSPADSQAHDVAAMTVWLNQNKQGIC